MGSDPYDVRCRECGLPLRRLGDGVWMHRKGGAVAACDLDSDHPPVPDVADDAHAPGEASA
ncbi:MAG: hypothetical protein KDC33_12145 [Thermoleophilia bacterium]|nr:hypothetical protein [Thermoleophilia bacterium]